MGPESYQKGSLSTSELLPAHPWVPLVSQQGVTRLCCLRLSRGLLKLETLDSGQVLGVRESFPPRILGPQQGKGQSRWGGGCLAHSFGSQVCSLQQ